ncbi:lysophospholipid acyltransferase family protein [uncultured Rikenella sp.]|uniref:lysophospholipid acyltransferase family protein n=1 Tax=uncultured Rikenella sp. TaxID=368003 RepID=UPI00261C94D1|nr:lysophospholipid acyltransferase family protein [uncultured Rikenella sp.]
MNRLKTIYYLTLLALFTVAIFGVFATVWVLTVLFDRDRAVCHHVSRFWSKTLFRLCPWWSVQVEGAEHVRPGRSYVVVSNHQAMLDIPLLYVLPFNFKWVSKKEVYKIPVFGWVLWMHGDVAIERGASTAAKIMLAQCEDYLKRGVSIVMFPEGTRTKTGCVNTFKEGAMVLAQQSGADILPVVIDGTFDAFAEGRIVAPHVFRVRILPAVGADEISRTSPKELRDTLNTWMRDTHQMIAPRHYKDKQ